MTTCAYVCGFNLALSLLKEGFDNKATYIFTFSKEGVLDSLYVMSICGSDSVINSLFNISFKVLKSNCMSFINKRDYSCPVHTASDALVCTTNECMT